MKVDVEKLVSRIEEIYGCGAKEDGTHSRMAYSEEDIRARKLFAGYGRKLGMQTRMDEAGNLILRMEWKNETLPAIQLGSHLDTVPDGANTMVSLAVWRGWESARHISPPEKSQNIR